MDASDATGALADGLAECLLVGGGVGCEDELVGCGDLVAVPVDLADAEVDLEGGAEDVAEEGEVVVFAFELVLEEGLDAAGGFVVFGSYALDGDGVFGGAEGFEEEGEDPVDGGFDVAAGPVGVFGEAGEFGAVVVAVCSADVATVFEVGFDAAGVVVFGTFFLTAKFFHDAVDFAGGEGG